MNTQILKDIVINPRKYDHILNAPSKYDAAQELYTQHFNGLAAKERKACEGVLIKSGKWIYNKMFEVIVDNSQAQSHNINIDYPTFFCFAKSKEEAVGKMMLSDFQHKNRPVTKIVEL